MVELSNEQAIQELEILIDLYKMEKRELDEMNERWENGDPESDPGLQYSQEMKIEDAFEHIKIFVKSL